MKLPVKLLMSLISLVSVIARAGEYKNYSRDEIKYWRYTSYKGGKLPEGFTDEKFSSAIYNGRIFTMKRLHTLMLFLAVLFTGRYLQSRYRQSIKTGRTERHVR